MLKGPCMEVAARFKLVFVKLREELVAEKTVAGWERPMSEVSLEELEELDEFRRSVQEVTDIEPQSFTTT